MGQAASALAARGCEVEPVSLEAWAEWPAQDISMSFFSAEGTAYLEPFYQGREDELTWYIQRRLSLPAPSLGDFVESIEKTELLRQELARFFSQYDLLLVPTGPVPAHPHEAAELVINGVSVQGRNSLRATVPFDMTGSPAVSVPFGWNAQGLPIGVQLAARHFDEATLLHAAAVLEREGSGRDRRPTV